MRKNGDGIIAFTIVSVARPMEVVVSFIIYKMMKLLE